MCEAYLRGRQGQQLRVSVVAVPLVWESSAAPAAGLPAAAALGHGLTDRWPRWCARLPHPAQASCSLASQ